VFFLDAHEIDLVFQVYTEILVECRAKNDQLFYGLSFLLHRLGQGDIGFEHVVSGGYSLLEILLRVILLNLEACHVLVGHLHQFLPEKRLKVGYLDVAGKVEAGFFAV
jgi:hypothetical protein